MFYGEYTHNLDDKDRFVLPSKFRSKSKQLKIKSFYLTRGLDKCLFLFPEGEWEKLEDSFKSLPFTKSESRAFNRLFFSGAVQIEFDSLGRATIPEYLKEFAGIKREVVVAGISNRIEIWSKESWEDYYRIHREKFESIAQDLIV